MIQWEDVADSVQLDRVLDELGINVTSIVRGEHWASCPLSSHPGSDAKPSFSINEDTLLWSCFTCNEGGLLPSLVADVLNYQADEDETAFQKGLQWLLPYADADVDSDDDFLIQIERYTDRAIEKKRIGRKVEMPYYSPTALDKYDYCPVDLLEKWHIIVPRAIEKFGIRYDENHRRKQTDYVGPCILVPHWWQGELVGYQQRWLGDRPDWLPKYTNSDDFPKSHTLFNFDRAVKAAREGDSVTVVEAALTVVRLDQLDIPAVATFGASIRPEQFKLLSSFSALILARDEDPDYRNEKGRLIRGAGVKAYEEAVEVLSAKVDLYHLPPNPIAKGDLADLDDDQVLSLYDSLSAVNDPLIDAGMR